MADNGFDFPSDDCIGDTLFFATQLPVANLVEVNDQISAHRPSINDYNEQQRQKLKEEKRKLSLASKKGKKKIPAHIEVLHQKDLEIIKMHDSESFIPSSKFQNQLFNYTFLSVSYSASALPSASTPTTPISKRPLIDHTSEVHTPSRAEKRRRFNTKVDAGNSSNIQVANVLNAAMIENYKDEDEVMYDEKNEDEDGDVNMDKEEMSQSNSNSGGSDFSSPL